jgi:hypothetical protein
MVSAIQIREQLRAWLEGRVPLHEFEDWFVSATWDAHKWTDREAELLADEIELNLSEYTDRVIGLQELKDRLYELADRLYPVRTTVRFDVLPGSLSEDAQASFKPFSASIVISELKGLDLEPDAALPAAA